MNKQTNQTNQSNQTKQCKKCSSEIDHPKSIIEIFSYVKMGFYFESILEIYCTYHVFNDDKHEHLFEIINNKLKQSYQLGIEMEKKWQCLLWL